MADEEFEVGAYTYKVGSMDLLRQHNVARRLAPLIKAFQAGRPQDEIKIEEGQAVFSMMSAMEPVIDFISQMKDEDSDYIIGHCMSVVSRKVSGDRGWAAVWSVPAAKPMFVDIDLMTMLQIVWKVVEISFIPFSQGQRSI